MDIWPLIEEGHNCPAVCGVWSVPAKLLKPNKRKWRTYWRSQHLLGQALELAYSTRKRRDFRCYTVSSKPLYFFIAFCVFSGNLQKKRPRHKCHLHASVTSLHRPCANERVSWFDASLTQLWIPVWRPMRSMLFIRTKQNALNEFWQFLSQPCLLNFFFQSYVRTWMYMRVKTQWHWKQKVRVSSSDVISRV